MNFVLKYLDSITLIVSAAATALYVVAVALLQPFDADIFLAKAITFALTLAALVSSSLFLLLAAFQDSAWFGNVAPYRFHIGFGCLVAVLASAFQIVGAVRAIM